MNRGSEALAPDAGRGNPPAPGNQRVAALRLDGSLSIVALTILLICLLYTFAYPLLGHYPGVSLTFEWVVLDVDHCDPSLDWCRANQGQLLRSDRLLQIGDLTYVSYAQDRTAVPFGAFNAGSRVPVILQRNDQTIQAYWYMPDSTNQVWNIALFNLLFVLPFWFAGTVVMLFLRPRDRRWVLLVLFNYLIAIWLAAGFTSNTHLGGSAFVVRMVGWLMVPVFLHLHLHVPDPLSRLSSRISLLPFYLVFIALALGELWSLPPPRAYIVSDALVVLASLGLISYRLLHPMSMSDRIAARLMLTGFVLAFAPGMLLWVIPILIDSNPPVVNTAAFATLVLPALPLFYTYAAYKHRLGTLEFRANRLLSTYSFISLYSTAFLFVFSLLGRWLHLSTNALLVYLVCSVIFIVIALPLRQRFVRFVDRLAYGTEHNPDELIRAFANRIPQALTRDDLVKLLVREIMPSLLIRQSALIVIPSDLLPESAQVAVDTVYAQNIVMPPSWPATALHDLLAAAGRYRPYETRALEQTSDWPRLAITFSVGEGTRGIWLLGERHPDDFYPQKDIDLLATLGNQVGVTLHTAGLLLESRRFAQDLKALHVVSSMVASTLQPQEVYKRTVETLAQVFGYGYVSIYRVEGERLQLQYQVGYDPAKLIWDLPLTTGVMARAVRTRQAQFVPDASLDVDFQRELPALVSEVAVPVQNAEQVLGVINVESAVAGQLTINDLDLLLILANQLAIAIVNARLYEDARARAEKLAVAYADLKQLDRLKDEFVQTVSHELRTPLTFVCGYVDLLLENALGDLSAQQREALTIVADRAAAMVHLVNDIINLQQMELQTHFHSPVDLSSLAQACAQGARVTALRKGIAVEVKTAPDLPHVAGDPNRLGEVLDNLLDNAIKFSPNGGVITIRVEQMQARFQDTDQQPQAGVKVTISDTGIGIAEDQLSRVWDRFYQVDGTKTRRFGGAGLGLAIVKRIIEAHGGLIGVESQLGAGSSFWFMLPASHDGAAARQSELHPLR